MVSPGGYLSAGDAPRVIHRVVFHLFLPEFEAALPFLLNHVTVLCHILGSLCYIFQERITTVEGEEVLSHTHSSAGPR